MKKLLLMIIGALIAIPALAFDFEYTHKGQTLKYSIKNYNEVEVSTEQSTEISGDLIIPSSVKYDGKKYKVTEIDREAFISCNKLISVTIPKSVTKICYGAFEDCNNLTSVTIPNSVMELYGATFKNCKSLTSVTIPNKIIEIRGNTFRGCSSLVSVTIPNTVKEIDERAFMDCVNLSQVTISNSVTKIEKEAFANCRGMASVTIGNSVTEIGEKAFSGCDKLTSVTIPNSVTKIGKYAFFECGELASLTIGESVTEIGNNAFTRTQLTSLTIPQAVTHIGDGVFSHCPGLKYITFVDGDKILKFGFDVFRGAGLENLYLGRNFTGAYSLTMSTFSGDTSLKTLTIGDSVTAIVPEAFSGCSGLTSLTIGKSVKIIGKESFYGCSGLTSITIPSSVTIIGDYAFSGCSGLTSMTIPYSVTDFGAGVFANCTNLHKIDVEEANKDYCSIDGILFNYARNALISYPAGRKGGYTIPNGITEIRHCSFDDCVGLTSVMIPKSVTVISDFAFNGCSGLTSVVIPQSVNLIGPGAFGNCTSLTKFEVEDGNQKFRSIDGVLFNKDKTQLMAYPAGKTGDYVIPSTVTEIGTLSFQGCRGLTSITIPKSLKNWLTDCFFSGCNDLTSIYYPSVDPIGGVKLAFGDDDYIYKNATLYVPDQAINTFKRTSPWEYFEKIEAYDFPGSDVANYPKYGRLEDAGFDDWVDEATKVLVKKEVVVVDGKTDGEKIYDLGNVKVKPEFPGGEAAMYEFMRNNLHYPVAAQEDGIYGTVVVLFTIDKKGNVTNVKAVRSPHESLSKEAVRMVSSMPKWKPGRNDENKAVKVNYTIPIRFGFTKSDTPTE